jgi:hypothetical protein
MQAKYTNFLQISVEDGIWDVEEPLRKKAKYT